MPRDSTSEQPASGDAAGAAYADLAVALAEIEAKYIGPERGMHSAAERSAGRYLLANALQHGFGCWFDCDPKRPVFQRWLSPTKKLLGDNPDAVYYGAVVDPAGTYRIRGNVHGASYTSFSVETGAQEGHLSKGVVSTLNDTEFEIAIDGSYEIIASPEPHPNNCYGSSRAPGVSLPAITGSGSAASQPTRPSTCRCGSNPSRARGRLRRWTTPRSRRASNA
jgi:hypothetical protein